jgi:uncharacterized membrane protein YgaE (UPF0421/DUF939 family)
MDVTLILTLVGIAVAIIGCNIALISWLRSDMKSFENKIETWTIDFRKDVASYKDAINKEMRDFHGRLCAIDERTHNKPKTDP